LEYSGREINPFRVMASCCASTAMQCAENSPPMTMAMRLAVSWTSGAANISFPFASTLKRISGWARARRVITSRQAPCSVASVFKNLRRAGTWAKMPLTDICVPSGVPAGSMARITPPSRIARVPDTSFFRLVNISTLATEAMLGIASPRKPNDTTLNMSSN